MFCAVCLPRKWSIRKTSFSANVGRKRSLSASADCEVVAERLLDDDPALGRELDLASPCRTCAVIVGGRAR